MASVEVHISSKFAGSLFFFLSEFSARESLHCFRVQRGAARRDARIPMLVNKLRNMRSEIPFRHERCNREHSDCRWSKDALSSWKRLSESFNTIFRLMLEIDID